jgi:transposase
MSLFPTDMRRGFDGLAALVREVVREDPLSGHLFVFFNRRRDRVKILWWDRSGYAVWYKRLERGAFRPHVEQREGVVVAEVEAAELALVLEGIELAGARRRSRFHPADGVLRRPA